MGDTESRRLPSRSDGYELREQIGSGLSGVVYRAWCSSIDDEVAIRIIDLDQLQASLEDIQRDIKVMSLSSHPNVLPFSTCFVSGHDLWVVMPLLTGGSVSSLLACAYPDGLPPPVATYILHSVVAALDYFHSNGLIHRDVRAANIMLDARGQALLSDYGMMGWMVEGGWERKQRQTFVGTPCWMAPEVMEQTKGYDYKADIWSLGITAIELAMGAAPYLNYPPMKVLIMTLQNDPPSLSGRAAKEYPEEYKQFISACLQKDPEKRMSAKQMLGHAVFEGVAKPPDLEAVLARLPPIGSRSDTQKQLFRQLRKASAPSNSGIWNLSSKGQGWDFADDEQNVEVRPEKSISAEDKIPSRSLIDQSSVVPPVEGSASLGNSTQLAHPVFRQINSSSMATGEIGFADILQSASHHATFPALSGHPSHDTSHAQAGAGLVHLDGVSAVPGTLIGYPSRSMTPPLTPGITPSVTPGALVTTPAISPPSDVDVRTVLPPASVETQGMTSSGLSGSLPGSQMNQQSGATLGSSNYAFALSKPAAMQKKGRFTVSDVDKGDRVNANPTDRLSAKLSSFIDDDQESTVVAVPAHGSHSGAMSNSSSFTSNPMQSTDNSPTSALPLGTSAPHKVVAPGLSDCPLTDNAVPTGILTTTGSGMEKKKSRFEVKALQDFKTVVATSPQAPLVPTALPGPTRSKSRFEVKDVDNSGEACLVKQSSVDSRQGSVGKGMFQFDRSRDIPAPGQRPFVPTPAQSIDGLSTASSASMHGLSHCISLLTHENEVLRMELSQCRGGEGVTADLQQQIFSLNQQLAYQQSEFDRQIQILQNRLLEVSPGHDSSLPDNLMQQQMQAQYQHQQQQQPHLLVLHEQQEHLLQQPMQQQLMQQLQPQVQQQPSTQPQPQWQQQTQQQLQQQSHQQLNKQGQQQHLQLQQQQQQQPPQLQQQTQQQLQQQSHQQLNKQGQQPHLQLQQQQQQQPPQLMQQQPQVQLNQEPQQISRQQQLHPENQHQTYQLQSEQHQQRFQKNPNDPLLHHLRLHEQLENTHPVSQQQLLQLHLQQRQQHLDQESNFSNSVDRDQNNTDHTPVLPAPKYTPADRAPQSSDPIVPRAENSQRIARVESKSSPSID
jgi:serine/threonine protein kinase